GETSVEELENPVPRHPRLGYVHDENSTDSVSTANILNPPVQAYGKGLGDVAASIERPLSVRRLARHRQQWRRLS
ncbi:hypothetical protein FOZ62_006886, partial [Perkinsus olseni]